MGALEGEEDVDWGGVPRAHRWIGVWRRGLRMREVKLGAVARAGMGFTNFGTEAG